MKLFNLKYIVIILALVVIATLLSVNQTFHQQETVYSDLWHSLSGQRDRNPQVVIVSLDEETLNQQPDEPLVFWGPYFASAIERLRQAGAGPIGLDFIFSFNAEAWFQKHELDPTLAMNFEAPIRQQLFQGDVVLAAAIDFNSQGEATLLLPIDSLWRFLPNGLADVGLLNLSEDQDGVVRQFIPQLLENDIDPRFGFATLLASKSGTTQIDAQATERFNIGYLGGPGTIPSISFSRLLDETAFTEQEQALLKNKIIIISAEHAAHQDRHQTPYDRFQLGGETGLMTGPMPKLMNGAEIQANIIETLLSGRSPRQVTLGYQLGFLFILIVAIVLLFFRLSVWKAAIAALIIVLALTVPGYLAFTADSLFPVFLPQLIVAIAFTGIIGLRLTGEERERRHMRKVFGRYIPDTVVDKLMAKGARPDLGEMVDVTIMFSDIRNFTTLSEILGPRKILALLNAYYERSCERIMAHGGIIDKFMGDGIMVIFGSPEKYPDHARRALQAAIEMRDVAQDFQTWVNQHHPDLELPEFDIGIGINTGEALAGNIGFAKRSDFATIGDTTNTAARLEGLTKTLGWKIVASAATIDAAGDIVITDGQDTCKVKGRDQEVDVFEVVDLKTGEPLTTGLSETSS